MVVRAKMKPRGKPFAKGERDPRAGRGPRPMPFHRDAPVGSTPGQIRAALRLAFAERIPFLQALIDGKIPKLIYEKKLTRTADGKDEEIVASVTRLEQVDERTRLAAMDLLARYGVGLSVEHDVHGEIEHRHYVARAPLELTADEWDRLHGKPGKKVANG